MPISGQIVDRNNLSGQMRYYGRRSSAGITDTSFVCSKCGKKYLSKTSLSLHTRLECGKEPQFQCPHCRRRFHQGGSLNRHVRTLHPNEPISREGERDQIKVFTEEARVLTSSIPNQQHIQY